MATKKDFYDILGVPRNADKDKIKSAYRELAKKYHPDINKEPGAEEKFKEIKEAYDVLYDDEKRANYDQFGHEAFEQQQQSGFSGFSSQSNFDFEDLGDIFGSFFGGSKKTSKSPTKGNDIEMKVKISFMDSINGKNITLDLTYDKKCNNCYGIGGEISVCSKCNGNGYLNKQSRSIFGMLQSRVTCSRCNGSGKEVIHTCSTCRGNGFIKTKEKLDVKIPSGINDGQQIRLAGKGSHGYNGGNNGDLYLEIKVEPHKIFERKGNDIHITIASLTFIDLILGTEIEVPTVYGNTMLKIPSGTQPNQIFRLKGKGAKNLRSIFSYGDEYVHLDIKTPTNLNKKQISLLNEVNKEIKNSKKN